MSISTDLARLDEAKAAIIAAIEAKGVTVPDGTKIDGMATLIAAIKGGVGGYPYNVSNFTYVNYDGAVTVTWTDTDDADWAGTVIVAKQGSYPDNAKDGVVIVDSKVRDQYATEGYTKTDMAEGVWHFQAFPYSADGEYSDNVVNRLEVTVEYVYPSALIDFAAVGGNAQVTLTFTLPEDAVSVDIAYKAGSYPTSKADGTLITNAQSGEVVSGLAYETTYYFRAFPVNAAGRVNTATEGNQTEGTTEKWFPAKDTLENTSWENIDIIASAGKASEYWSAGDQKTIDIGGVNYSVEIMSFDHDDLADGSGKAPITFGMVDCLNTMYPMNSSNTNAGGWGSCALRSTLQNTIFSQLPADLRAVIKPVKKLASAGSQSTTINSYDDTLFLFSEQEIFGAKTHSTGGEGTQYARFAVSASRVKGVNGSAANWWERSPYASNSAGLCVVTTSGAALAGDASFSRGVAFGFCVGKLAA